MSSDSKKGRLPFEPRNRKKKSADKPPVNTDRVSKPKAVADTAKSPARTKAKSTSRSSRPNSNLSAIPDVVSKRMGRRMAVFCGIPSALGMSSLFVFYWLKVKDIIELPPYTAFAVSFGFLGLGVLGLSYGLFFSLLG